jgi:hypothetical protein
MESGGEREESVEERRGDGNRMSNFFLPVRVCERGKVSEIRQ